MSFQNWQARQQIEREEADRINYLRNAPSPKNDPALLEPVEVTVIRAFCVAGKPVTKGQTTTIERNLAESLAAIGKCSIVKT